MIKLLRINTIALVDSVEVELDAGLTLLTGETGAGKSILIDALSLLLGARASSEVVRSGEDTGVVEAVVESPALAETLTVHALRGRRRVVVRRCVSGRGKATVNRALVLACCVAVAAGGSHTASTSRRASRPETHLDRRRAPALTGPAVSSGAFTRLRKPRRR
jgi:predicted ATPase